MSDELTPITRKETFLAKAGGQNVVTPTPITREETFLQAIIDNGSGGGGGTGGGVLVLHDNEGTFDKTWQEIADAFDNGSIIVADYNSKEGRSRAYLVGISIIHSDYVVIIRDFGDNVDVVYATNSASGYPTYTE